MNDIEITMFAIAIGAFILGTAFGHKVGQDQLEEECAAWVDKVETLIRAAGFNPPPNPFKTRK